MFVTLMNARPNTPKTTEFSFLCFFLQLFCTCWKCDFNAFPLTAQWLSVDHIFPHLKVTLKKGMHEINKCAVMYSALQFMYTVSLREIHTFYCVTRMLHDIIKSNQ